MRNAIRQLFSFALIAALVAAVLGYVDYKWLEPNRVPPCNPDSLEKGRICLQTVLSQWGDRVIWVDARGEDAYERGTINRKPVVPLRNDDRAQDLLEAAMPVLFMAEENNQCIVIFCDRNCNSSADVAAILKQYQVEAPIYVLEGGWDEIKKNPTLVP